MNKFSFSAMIYKNGINPCVDVPFEITSQLTAQKGGFVKVKGKINDAVFHKSLMPVKSSDYRLFVNAETLKESGAQVGDTVFVEIEQDFNSEEIILPDILQNQLKSLSLVCEFESLTKSRKKDICNYISYLKTEKAKVRAVDRVISQLMNISLLYQWPQLPSWL